MIAWSYLSVIVFLATFEGFWYEWMLSPEYKYKLIRIEDNNYKKVNIRLILKFFWSSIFTVSYHLLSTLKLSYIPKSVILTRLIQQHVTRMVVQTLVTVTDLFLIPQQHMTLLIAYFIMVTINICCLFSIFPTLVSYQQKRQNKLKPKQKMDKNEKKIEEEKKKKEKRIEDRKRKRNVAKDKAVSCSCCLSVSNKRKVNKVEWKPIREMNRKKKIIKEFQNRIEEKDKCFNSLKLWSRIWLGLFVVYDCINIVVFMSLGIIIYNNNANFERIASLSIAFISLIVHIYGYIGLLNCLSLAIKIQCYWTICLVLWMFIGFIFGNDSAGWITGLVFTCVIHIFPLITWIKSYKLAHEFETRDVMHENDIEIQNQNETETQNQINQNEIEIQVIQMPKYVCWTCKKCTYKNISGENNNCKMCENPIAMSMKCRNCKTWNADNLRFCSLCNSLLNSNQITNTLIFDHDHDDEEKKIIETDESDESMNKQQIEYIQYDIDDIDSEEKINNESVTESNKNNNGDDSDESETNNSSVKLSVNEWKNKYVNADKELRKIININSTTNNLSNNVSSWTTNQVSVWLIALGLQKYTTKFKNHSIDGVQLLHLEHYDIKRLIKQKGKAEMFTIQLKLLKEKWNNRYMILPKQKKYEISKDSMEESIDKCNEDLNISEDKEKKNIIHNMGLYDLLGNLQMTQYFNLFKQNGYNTISSISQLNKDILVNEIGIDDVANVHKIINAVNQINNTVVD